MGTADKKPKHLASGKKHTKEEEGNQSET